MVTRSKWLIFALVLAFSLQGFAQTVKDDLGRTVKLPERIRRVVSLAPSATENLFAIGAGHLVVGVTSACDYPSQVKKLPQVGDFMKPSLERIAALKPDLIVIVSSTIPKAIADDLQAKTKVPVFVFQPQTVSSVLRGLLTLGGLTGRKQQAKKLVQKLERRLNAVQRRVANKPRPKVVVEIAPPPSLMVAGPKTFIDDAIRLAGGENAFKDAHQPFPLISLESLVAEDPDVYIVAIKGKTSKQLLEEVKRRSGFENLRCVQKGRIYGIDPDLIFRPTPRLIEGIEKLEGIFHRKASETPASIRSLNDGQSKTSHDIS
ncbi:MAG: cobalamin-binding protein [Armatimonadetes bacterium]|nr:cobalamin-binding protein [Armatimonadota bacterium]MDW8027850.1 cobalamin-binding protein [Armatimonadota bacterium]